MKRLFVMLGCIVCIMLMFTHALAEGADYTMLSSGPMGDIRDICGQEGEWYLLSGLGVYRWAGPGTEPERMVDLSLIQRNVLSGFRPTNAAELRLWEKGVGRIFQLDGQLMGLHPYTGQISLIQDGETVPFAQLPEEQFFTAEQDEPMAKEITGFAAQDGVLYMTFSAFSIQQGEVTEFYAWKPGDGEMTMLDAPGLAAIYPSSGHELLARVRDDNTIRLYDTQAQAYTRTLWTEPEDDIFSGYAWDAESETLCCLDFQGGVQVVAQSGQAQTKAYLPLNFAVADRAFLLRDNTCVFLAGGSLFIRSLDADGDAERISLKIIGMPDGNILADFAAVRPDVMVSSSYEATDFLSVQQAMVSSDSSVDLYMINSNRAYAAVKDKGYAASLSASEVLAGRAAGMYPAIRDVLMKDGDLVAYPASMLVDSWAINATQWEALGLGDYPETWEELIELLALWERDYAEENPSYQLLDTGRGFKGFVALAVRQYLLENEAEGQLVSFDDDRLRQVLETMLAHRELLEDKLNGGELIPLMIPATSIYGTDGFDSDTVVQILPPALTKDSPRRVSATMELFVLNPLSEHPQEAMAFLEYYAGHMAVSWQYELTPENNVPVRSSWYEAQQKDSLARIDYLTQALDTLDPAERRETEGLIAAERKRYERREAEDWAVTQESIDIYQSIAANLTIPLHSVYTGDATRSRDEVIDQAVALFADGRLTVEQFIKMLDEKAEMVFQEGV